MKEGNAVFGSTTARPSPLLLIIKHYRIKHGAVIIVPTKVFKFQIFTKLSSVPMNLVVGMVVKNLFFQL